MNVDERIFAPERGKLGTEAILSVIGIATLGPLFMWWKDVPWVWWGPCLAFALGLALAKDVYALKFRGRDFVAIAPEGIRVTNRRKVWLFRWTEIEKVYRFKEQLVFETAAPHRRETLSLEGHDKHERALLEAIGAKAQSMNLRWVQTVADLLG